MASRQQRLYRGGLAGTKILEAEHILQDAPLGIAGKVWRVLIHAAL